METTAPTDNPYGLIPALQGGGLVAQSVFAILVFMSLVSWYIIITKYLEQRKVLNEAKDIDKKFWTAPSIREGASKLPKDSAFRQLAEDGLRASEHHEGRLTDQIAEHEWITMSMARSHQSITSKLQTGLAFLASVGSTSPFIGLFGTVVGIYRALIGIGIAGQASIDKVAGPVGEALIMTALGLVVAVPAVLGYNWLIRRNKDVIERLTHFAADVQGSMMSGGKVPASSASTAMKASSATITPSQAVSGTPGKA